jgi:hypothetical protein
LLTIYYFTCSNSLSLLSREIIAFGAYGSASNKKASVHVFKHNDKWYKVTIKVDEMALDNNLEKI